MTREANYFRPLWDDFDGEAFQDLICDLLSAEGYTVEPSGVGPDGGVDMFAQQHIVFGYNSPEPFTWAVQCKFTSAGKSISPAQLGPVLNIVHDERFKSKGISGYFLATNGRLSANTMSEMRGLKNVLPGFKTTYWDRSRVHDLVEQHYEVYKKYFAPPAPEPKPATSSAAPQEIDEFEALINSPDTREVEIQAFLEAHPAFLTLGIGKDGEVVSQIALDSEDRATLRPDFVINPGTGDSWGIVELRRPSVRLTVGQHGRGRLSFHVMEALAQLQCYKAYFDDPGHREAMRRKFGLDVYTPRLVLLAGWDFEDLTPEEVAKVQSLFPDVEIVTYRWLIERVKKSLG